MRKIIKNLSLLGIFFISLNVHSLQGLNVITITTDDPQWYVEWLTEIQPVV